MADFFDRNFFIRNGFVVPFGYRCDLYRRFSVRCRFIVSTFFDIGGVILVHKK